MTQPAAVLASLLALVLATPAATAQTTFEIEPAAPVSTDTVQIRATYLSSCFIGLGRAEVLAGAIRLNAFEACACPPVLPGPVELVTTVDSLAPGTYTVELYAAPRPFDPQGCDFAPRLEGSTELRVAQGPELLAIEPPAPTTGDEVTVRLRSQCPLGVEAPSRRGSVLRITTIPSLSLAPCHQDPVYEIPLWFGRLPAGDYAVVVVFDDGPGEPYLVRTASFRVFPAAEESLALQAGRFRVRADWRTEGGRTGVAQAYPLTTDTGTFWFFSPGNLELTVKALDGCAVNGRYWFFASGLTNLGVTLHLEDTVTGQERLYEHPAGRPFAPILDTRAFPCP